MIFLFSLCACATLKKEIITKGNANEAINNAVSDFIHTERSIQKKDNAFWVYADTVKNNIVVTIIGDSNKVLLIKEDGNYSYRDFPTILIESDEKIFLGYEKEGETTDTIINTLYRYNFVDTMIVNTYIPDRMIDESKKGVIYFFCKNDLSVYKKIHTNTIAKHHKHPQLKCIKSAESGKKNQ